MVLPVFGRGSTLYVIKDGVGVALEKCRTNAREYTTPCVKKRTTRGQQARGTGRITDLIYVVFGDAGFGRA